MLVFFLLAAACNAIDGADSYRRGAGDGGDAAPSVCTQACLDTSGTCLNDCASALASCTSACNSNPGCTMKCNNTSSTCTTDCVSTCTACGCSQSDCSNQPPPDAGAD